VSRVVKYYLTLRRARKARFKIRVTSVSVTIQLMTFGARDSTISSGDLWKRQTRLSGHEFCVLQDQISGKFSSAMTPRGKLYDALRPR
jgi:hypothetical protein